MYTITFLPHTGDLSFEVTASSFEDVIRGAVAGMYEYMGPTALPGSATVSRTITAAGADCGELLVNFVAEVLSLSDTESDVNHFFAPTYLRGSPASKNCFPDAGFLTVRK